MAQQIGLEAVFDLGNFQKGMAQYSSSLGKAISETDKASGSFTKSFNAMGATVTKVTAIMGGALVAAGAAAGVALGKFAVDGIGQARDLEKQMSSIAAVLNMTAQEVAPLNDLILELGIDPNLSVSATQAADAIEMLARNGLSMGEIMDGAARSTVLLANATGADFATAADISTDAMAIFKINAEDMATAVNGITAVTNASKFSIDDYALALAQGGGVAAASGVEFDDFNASIAAISPLFASGSDAGTSYKTMIQRLVPQSKEAAQAMQTLGLDFFDANGQMKSMAEIATELNSAFMDEVTFSTQVSNMTAEQTSQKAMLEAQMKKLGMELFKYEVGLNGVAQSEEDKIVSIDRLNRQMDAAKTAYAGLAGEMGTTITTTRALTEEERNHYLTTIFGTDAMRAAIGMAESGTVVYTDLATAAKETGLSQDLLNQYIEGGITQFELLEAQMSLIDANEQAKTRMDNFAGALEILSGVIETIQIKIGQAFLPALTEMTRAFTAFVEEHSDSIVAFFESIATWLGTNIPAAINSLAAAWPTIQAGFAVLAEFIPPIVSGLTMIAGIVGTVLSAAFALVKDNMAAFQGALAGIALVIAGSVISAGLTAIAGALTVLLSPLALVVVGVAALGAAWNTNFLGMQDKTLAAIGVIQSAFAPLTASIQQFGQGALTEIGLFVTGNETEFTNAKAIWAGAQTAFTGIFGGISEWLATNLPIFMATLTQWGTAAAQWITDALPGLMQAWLQWWQIIIGFFGQYHPLFNGMLAQWATSAWQWIVDAMPTVTAKLGEWWGIISGYVAGQLPAWKSALVEWANMAWGWIVDATGFVVAKLGEWWLVISGYVTSQLPAWKATLVEWATAAWQWIVDAAGQVVSALGQWWSSIQTYVTGQLPTWKATLIEWATVAWQWILDAASQVGAKLTEWWNEIRNYVVAQLPTWKATLVEWATSAWQWIIDAAGLVAGKLAEWWTEIQTYVTGQLPAWKSALVEWANMAWGWIVDAAGLVAGKLGEWWTEIETYVTGQLPTWQTTLASWADAAWQWIVDAAGLVAAKLGEWYAELNVYVTGQLPTWQALFTAWATALWQWIVDATTEVATKMGEWYTALSDYLTDNLPTWQTAFTEWGTAMVTWITDAGTKAQTELTTWATDLWDHATTDLLPKFKTKMLAWATGILEWISSADADPALKLAEWLGKITAWIPLGVAALVLEAAKLAGALIGWIAGSGNTESLVAQTDPEMEKFKTALTGALDNIKTIFLESVKAFVDSWKTTMNEHVNWNQLGKDIMAAVRDGIGSMLSSIRSKAQEIADAIKKIFTDLGDALVQIGKDLIQGLINGIWSMKDALFDKVRELAELMPEWMQTFLGMESPSKVFAEIGVNIVLGLIKGINQQQKAAINAIASLTDGMLRTVRTGTDRIIDSFSSAIGSLASVGGGLASRIEDALGEGIAMPGAVKTFRQMEQGVELLQLQADLIDMIRQAGLNPATVLAGVTLGANANPQQLLGIINTTMANMANQLNNSILVASRGLEFEIERLRTARRSIEDVERNAMQAQLSQLERYRNQVTKLDEEIAKTERNVLYSSGDVNQIKRLDEQREVILKDIETFLRQQAQLKQRMDNLPIANLTGRAATEAQAYIDKYITPLTSAFDKMTVVQRDATMTQINDLLTKLATFSYTAGHLGNVEKNVLAAVDGFGANVQNRVKAMLDTIYNPLTAVADRNQAISQLNTLANDLNRIQSRIDAQVGRHKSIDDFINELMPLDQIGYYKQRIGDVDKNLVRLNEQLLATGDVSLLERYTDLDMNRSEIEWELRKFLQQRQQFEQLLTRVAEMPEIGAQAAQKFYDDQIQPLVDAFSRPMTEAQRLANMALTQERITALNSYINAMERFEALKVDLTSGMGGDPTMRNLTRIEQMLQNINTSEAERNRLMQEYRTEQEKLLAIQQKQQRLDFLNQQLNIVKQLETLNKDYDDIISVQNILSGITLGMNASVDDMITLTSRAIDAMIRAAQHQLGIASPSKVFEAMGNYVMQGLGKGITNAAMQPLNALRNVTSDMPYTLAQRNLTINMGGVAISNGMDEIMFEQKVRRIVNGMPV